VKAAVLTYHSHHVQGPSYAHNDHIALPADLHAITRAGARIVSLATLVDAIEAHQSRCAAADSTTLVAITFDDGPVWDFADFVHPALGYQRSFANVLQDFRSTDAGRAQPGLSATSFVIASPEARRVMETTFDAEYTFLHDGALNDDWWSQAIATGLIAIGNHGVVIASDTPGSVRELFQAAEQDSYWVGDRRSPIVLFGPRGSSSLQLLIAHARRDGYADVVRTFEDPTEVVDFFVRTPPLIRQSTAPMKLGAGVRLSRSRAGSRNPAGRTRG